MDSFGLNIVFNFVDNASSGMTNVVGVFNQINASANDMSGSVAQSMQVLQSMSVVGSSLESLGSQALSMGEKVASSLVGVSMSIVDVGNQMFSARTRINKLFEDTEGGGEAMLQWVTDYAKTSVFEFENVLNGALMMKTAMIDVRDEIATTSGSAKQNILDYASDLAAFNPSAHNQYGTGVEAAMGAIKEYVAEGNAKSMQMGFSLDVTGILGQDKGSTAEERMQQIADLIDKVGMVGMTANLAGTAQNQLSNLGDTFFILKAKMADSGIFDFYTEMVSQISEAFSMGDEEIENMAKVFSDALLELAKPIKAVITGFCEVIKYIRELSKEHPEIFKLGVKIASITSIVLILGGVVLTTVGVFLKLTSGFGMLMTASAPISGIFTVMGASITTLVSTIAPLIVILAGLKYAWDNNLFGMRDTLEQTFGDIYDTVRITFDFLQDGSASLEDYKLAEKLGIIPFIQAMLNLKHAFGTFKEAFKAGFDSILNGLNDFSSKFEPVVIPVTKVFEKIGEVMNKFLGPDNESKWAKVGEVIGKIAGVASIAAPIILTLIKVIGLIANPIGLVITAAIGLITGLKYAWDNNLGGIQEKTAEFIEGLKAFVEKAKTTLAPVATFFQERFKKTIERTIEDAKAFYPVLQGIVKIVRDTFMKIVDVVKQYLIPAFKRVGEYIKKAFTAVVPIVGTVFSFIVNIVGKVVDTVRLAFQKMSGWIAKAMNGGLGKAINSVIEFIGKFIDTCSIIATWVWDNVISPIWGAICWLIDLIAPYVQQGIDFIWGIVQNVVSWICDTIGNIFNVVCDVFNGVVGVFNGIIDFIAGVFSGDWERAWNGIVEIFTGIWDTVVGVIKGVINAVINAINFCIRGINSVKLPDWVTELVGHEVSINIPEIPQLSTGGEVKKEGLSVIHPAEVVVNSETTSQLKKFLREQEGAGTRNKSKSNGDVVLKFEKESLVIHIEKADDSNLERVADKLIAIIMRKLEKRKMSIRNPIGGATY